MFLLKEMNIRNSKLYSWVFVALAALILQGCQWSAVYDYPAYSNIQCEETVHLTDDASSPFCDISMDYSCLNETGDSIAKLINAQLQEIFLGASYSSLVPEMAVDSFKNTYLREYRNEMLQLYQADIAKNGTDTELPPWYNRTYSLSTFLEEGHEGMILASANFFVDFGGAHPNQWSQWLNFDPNTGKLLTGEDLFITEKKDSLEQLLQQAVLDLNVALYPDTKIFIPENFLLMKSGVRFLYNRYDIAPRSTGSIEVELPYEVVGTYLRKNNELWN